MKPQTRSAIKSVVGGIAALLGAGFLMEGAMAPGNAVYLMVFVVAAITWGNMALSDRETARQNAIIEVFGVNEKTLKSTFGLSEARITEILKDPSERSEFSERLRKAMGGMSTRE